MKFIISMLWLIPIAAVIVASGAGAYVAPSTPTVLVREMLRPPEATLDYKAVSGLIDGLLDPQRDPKITDAMIDRLVDAARQMAGPNPTDAYKLAAIRKAIYVAGAWNYNRAFEYDQTDPFGRVLINRLLSTYIRTRKGNCVSMPILFLIVADRMGLNVHLAAAPLHLFVRYTDPQGIDHNLETTSGGHEARTEWYRQNLPMSDKAMANGVYMRTLTKRESIAEMASIVLDALLDQRRYQEAIEVADAIIAANPREAYAMVKRGSAYGSLLQAEFIDKYPDPTQIPPALRARYMMLGQQNQKAFKDAEALGWEPTS
jgi:regulator of sirC expression with transglutaminase-like and TPR domain